MKNIKYTANDIALWILNYNKNLREFSNEDTEDITNLKLQKLLYYAQGFYMEKYNTPLFNEELEAWTHGPVVPEVYHKYKSFGSKGIDKFEENKGIDKDTVYILKEIYDIFGKFSAWGLRNITHSETPWNETPRGEIIAKDKIKTYFKEHADEKRYLFNF